MDPPPTPHSDASRAAAPSVPDNIDAGSATDIGGLSAGANDGNDSGSHTAHSVPNLVPSPSYPIMGTGHTGLTPVAAAPTVATPAVVAQVAAPVVSGPVVTTTGIPWPYPYTGRCFISGLPVETLLRIKDFDYINNAACNVLVIGVRHTNSGIYDVMREFASSLLQTNRTFRGFKDSFRHSSTGSPEIDIFKLMGLEVVPSRDKFHFLPKFEASIVKVVNAIPAAHKALVEHMTVGDLDHWVLSIDGNQPLLCQFPNLKTVQHCYRVGQAYTQGHHNNGNNYQWFHNGACVKTGRSNFCYPPENSIFNYSPYNSAPYPQLVATRQAHDIAVAAWPTEVARNGWPSILPVFSFAYLHIDLPITRLECAPSHSDDMRPRAYAGRSRLPRAAATVSVAANAAIATTAATADDSDADMTDVSDGDDGDDPNDGDFTMS